MRDAIPFLLLFALILSAGAAWAADRKEGPEEAESIAKALQRGELAVTLRYRYEDVSDDAFVGDAHASTLRSTLSYRSARYRGFGLFAEFEDVTDIGAGDQHDNAGAGSLFNGVSDRPKIADPDLTEINQVYLRYSDLPETVLTAGRQEIRLADLRFVGAVGWRQNHQSFDAFEVRQGSIPRTALTYAFIESANRIFGDNKPMSSHLLHAKVGFGDAGSLTPYVYRLDYERLADSGASTTTFGASWDGRCELGRDWTLPYHVQLAQQSDTGDNPADVDAGYVRVEVGGERRGLSLRAGWELLEGSAADGRFTTPLATLHKFNGWADKFLNTPANGLEDLFFGVGGKRGSWGGVVVYHDFGSDSLGIDYGSELDAQVNYKAPWGQTFAIKAALYDADQFSTDTEKLMLWTSYAF